MTLYAVAAAAVAIIAVTAWITASEYKNLPDRVPMQFWFDGRPTSFGPRPVIWLIVGVQVFCAGLFVFTTRAFLIAPRTHSHALGMALFGLCIVAMIGYSQATIVEAAKSLPDQRLPTPRYWISSVAFLAAAVTCALLF